ncbi:hypothetical protein Dda_6932 [Drechslerella dactyloides]|uniref:Uncharacterized protein n=1 Tax=Drechslerella dactyloides TaxID=74499 RepID=A0AAD6ISV4_DREDA|nr:hypothetical protein Dda_6932 [Drechslerella dactyloides]
MRSSVTSFLLLGGAALVSSAPVSINPAHILHERNLCNPDNLLRLLRNEEVLADSVVFCSSYLSLPLMTVTVATVTPTVFVSETTTITKVDEVDKTITNTLTFTEFQTNTLTTRTETTNTQTVTVTATVYKTITNQLVKRTGSTPVSVRVATYDPSRISSACSCLTIPLAILSVSYTAPAVTTTVSASETVDVTSTVTETAEASTTVIEVTETITTITKVQEVEVTTTITTVLTTVTSLPPVVDKFVLRSNGPGVSQHYLKAVSHDGSSTVTHAIFTPDKAAATVWFLDSNGRLVYNNAGQNNAPWVSLTVGTADPREILWDTPVSAPGLFLNWIKNGNGNVVPDDPSLDKLQSCVPTETGNSGEKTLFIGTFIDNKNGCKSVDLHPEAPLNL